ncbi:nucleocapsid protein [meleucus virus]|uniref:Nucleocapsid n=1 Tax=meleucus virus TaxID=2940994 RepID=A0AAE9HRB7_9MONO|nr:nucleocapsid protein [meleucus virus]
MSGVLSALKDFKDAKLQPRGEGLARGAISVIKNKVAVIVPGQEGSNVRWQLLRLLLGVIWADEASPTVVTGALLSLISLIAESPANMVRRLNTDPDLAITIIEFTITAEGEYRFASRGVSYREQMDNYIRLRDSSPQSAPEEYPFDDPNAWDQDDIPMDEFLVANTAVQVQLWILLIKAVTAPDTARDGEMRRWVKFAQQRRVEVFYRMNPAWMDKTRNHLAADLSVRRYMIKTLIEIQRMGQGKGRLLETIADIGNYVEESGLAGFQLTIKFGIDTRYAALALNEFQGDIATIERLMRLYLELGPTAPFMVLLEESIQTKFAPGNYPLLWSYAMGVGSALDKAMANLNFNRSYLDYGYYRLGYRIVKQAEGSLDTKMARELEISPEEQRRLKRLIADMNIRADTDMDNVQGGTFQVADPAAFDFDTTDKPTGGDRGRGGANADGATGTSTAGSPSKQQPRTDKSRGFAAEVEAMFKRESQAEEEDFDDLDQSEQQNATGSSDPANYVGQFLRNVSQNGQRFNDALLLDEDV